MMDAAASLALLSALCVFVLKASGAYLCCILLSRLAISAEIRFVVWLGYLVGTAIGWASFLLSLRLPAVGPVQAASMTHATHFGITRAVPLHAAVYIQQLWLPLLLFYCLALALLASLGVWKRVQLARALRFRVAAPFSLAPLFRNVKAQVGLERCAVWLLPGLSAPAALGWWNPAVYLPSDCEDETEAALASILRHELAHIARRDALWEIFARLSRWLVFFHPLVHRAFSKLLLEREMACDMAVIQRGPDRRDEYAQTLVRFGWKTAAANQPDRVGIGFTSQASVLTARVRSILAGKRSYSRGSRITRVVGAVTTAVLFAAMASALWISFTLAFTPQPPVGIATMQPRAMRHTQPARAKHPTQVLLPASAPLLTNDISLEQHSSADRRHGFHVQNEEEPMSNPVADLADTTPEDTGESRATPGQGKSKSPSRTSILIDSATQLTRVALRGGRDHDRD